MSFRDAGRIFFFFFTFGQSQASSLYAKLG